MQTKITSRSTILYLGRKNKQTNKQKFKIKKTTEQAHRLFS